jgi:hypothetical protein
MNRLLGRAAEALHCAAETRSFGSKSHVVTAAATSATHASGKSLAEKQFIRCMSH